MDTYTGHDRCCSAASADGTSTTLLPSGEQPESKPLGELEQQQRLLKLLSGKFFRYDASHSYTSADGGKTWVKGGPLISYHGLGGALKNVTLQIQHGPYRGRIVIPLYLEMDGDHPDYSRDQRGGYAIWKGQKIVLETHTHVPEMAGSTMNFSDDAGQTWKHSRGFLMGYFEDCRLGHLVGFIQGRNR